MSDKLKGISYQAKPATIRWKNPNGTDSGITTTFNPDTGEPFGTGPAGTLNEPVFDSRYGGNNRPKSPDGTSLSFPIDAETILGAGTRAMQMAVDLGEQFGDGWTGTPETHDMKVSPRDAHDFAATRPGDFRALMARFGIGTGAPGSAGSLPGTPSIISAVSLSNGTILLTFRTRLEPYSFEIRVGDPSSPFDTYLMLTTPVLPHNRSARTYEVILPHGIGGELSLSVRAKLGNTSGEWSKDLKVRVKPRPGIGAETKPGSIIDPKPVDPRPVPKPEPGPTPGPVTPAGPLPASLTPASQRVDELWSWVNITLWPLLRPAAVVVLEFARGVLTRWKSR